ncbi:uncharacterized protein LOC131886363 [Tigriopus californicus]|uniref:uncharacterized protein LOC131886363 n=1 Tax=Tigriopus californicus TaxID=6832 RepID=UPI0027DA1E67|nr:uncharacterized protein LOC131886363 [Tigriopus californicus]
MFEPDDGGLFADIMPSNGNGSVPTQVKRRLDVRKPPTASVQSSRDSGHSTEGSSVHSQDSVISRSAGKLGQLGQNITPEMEFGAKEDPSLSEDENDETLIEEQPLSNEDRLAVQLEAALETNSSLIMDEANDVLEESDELDAVPELPSVAAYERRRSLLLEELHVYLIPREDWEGNRNLADKTVVDDCVSIGFVRVLPECTLSQLRRELMLQLEDNALPTKYVYVRGVGRHFTEVRSKQENQLKVRNFLPPQSQDPEIYLVEKFGSARSNNEATDYPYGGEFSDAEGAFIGQFQLRHTRGDL